MDTVKSVIRSIVFGMVLIPDISNLIFQHNELWLSVDSSKVANILTR